MVLKTPPLSEATTQRLECLTDWSKGFTHPPESGLSDEDREELRRIREECERRSIRVYSRLTRATAAA
jgi:hypothetical protein